MTGFRLEPRCQGGYSPVQRPDRVSGSREVEERYQTDQVTHRERVRIL